MERLYAPWRSDYLTKKKPPIKGCIFCVKAKENRDEKNYILFRGKSCFALLNLYPYNDGHVMIAPYRHESSPEKLSREEWSDLNETGRAAISAIKKIFKPDGFNLGMNLGKAAGAGVADHLHLHVVPRWVGDSNFLPLIGQTKVINQNLNTVYKKLAPLFPRGL